MALAANDEIVVQSGTENHDIRVVTPVTPAVRTLAGNGEAGFADGQVAATRFYKPLGLSRDKDGSILCVEVTESSTNKQHTLLSLVADDGNNTVRRVCVYYCRT